MYHNYGIADEKLTNATDPLLVKILKPPSSTFGISLSGASSPGSPIWITEVKQGSIADRYTPVVTIYSNRTFINN